MICYKDKTFCASKTENHTCGREITKEEQEHAKWGNMPIAYALFCEKVGECPRCKKEYALEGVYVCACDGNLEAWNGTA